MRAFSFLAALNVSRPPRPIASSALASRLFSTCSSSAGLPSTGGRSGGMSTETITLRRSKSRVKWPRRVAEQPLDLDVLEFHARRLRIVQQLPHHPLQPVDFGDDVL